MIGDCAIGGSCCIGEWPGPRRMEEGRRELLLLCVNGEVISALAPSGSPVTTGGRQQAEVGFCCWLF